MVVGREWCKLVYNYLSNLIIRHTTDLSPIRNLNIENIYLLHIKKQRDADPITDRYPL